MYIKITSKITIKLETITIRIYTFNLSLYLSIAYTSGLRLNL